MSRRLEVQVKMRALVGQFNSGSGRQFLHEPMHRDLEQVSRALKGLVNLLADMSGSNIHTITTMLTFALCDLGFLFKTTVFPSNVFA